MIKVLYSIATNIGSSGLGTVSKYAIKALNTHGLLELSISYNNTERLENNHISLFFNPFKLIKFINKDSYYSLKKSYFDFVVSRIIDFYKINTVHCWLNQSLFTIKKAKKKGYTVILESGSTHPIFKFNLLKSEYEELGLSTNRFNDSKINHALFEIHNADYILVPSEFAKKTFVLNGIENDKLHIIHRGVNISKYHPCNKNTDKINILFAGHIGVRKGVHYLLEAWKKLDRFPQFNLYLMGNIEEKFKDILKKYKDLKNITFLGFQEEPWHYFNRCHIFIFPTLEEGSAKVIYEAMASGMCVITTENAGSIIEDQKDGLIIPIKNAEKIYESIIKVSEDKTFKDYLSENAREKVKKYTWEYYQEKLIQFYKTKIIQEAS